MDSLQERSISVVIPTLNSERFLPECLESIRKQDYPAEKIEIIIADGGSTDSTREIARKYNCSIYSNPLKTAEAGKAVGVKHANGEIIALIDSDNILPETGWFRRMIAPFDDEDIAGAEPLYYTYRETDGYITRYCALIGANDPLCIFLGNYDRYSLLTNNWTGMTIRQEDMGDYLSLELKEAQLPTIGANGFLIRKGLLNSCSIEDYLFDIDIVYELVMQGHNKFAKVKTGIIHIFSVTMSGFMRKQKRRIRDYGYYQKIGVRKYPWSKLDKSGILKFILFTITIFPLVAQAAIGWSRKRDSAWTFHVLACWITLVIYAVGMARNIVRADPMESGSKAKVEDT